ncbi:MAG TPA: FGGY-family carbohydrate kinase [Candidatus Limnocylindrales bacterium]|nr:FGGY-family carbohydrate kinase [Candidatus Limnocylindrales bacterium]
MTRALAILAIDLGTTSAKGALVRLDGSVVSAARRSYPIGIDEANGRAEQDPRTWWDAVVSISRELVASDGGTGTHIGAIAVDGHGPTLVATDATGAVTRPAITWLDSRAGAELAELSAATGLRGWALGVLPAALWVERHESDVASRTCWYLNTWEYLAFRLSGVARTSLVDGQSLPDVDALRAAGFDVARVASPVAAGTVIGGLTSEAAAATGITAGTPVVAGVVDAFASFHGAGLLHPGDGIDTGGMSGGFGVYTSQPVEAAGSFCTPAPLPGVHVVGGAMAATGRALDWFRDDVLGGVATTEALIDEAARIDPGADGLLFLPYLAGERSPLWDPAARGAFVGLTLRHGRGHMTRAILEAAALAIRHVAEPIVAAGVDVDVVRVCGGPAQSETWNRIKADVTGFTVAVPHVLETAVVGSAIVGAVGIGAFADLPSAIRAMTRIDRVIEPRDNLRERYDELYRIYTSIHPAIAPILERRVAAGVR